MAFFSFDKLQEVWSFWELRGIVLFSLFLQSFLILASPLRKKTANAMITSLIWLAYLLADWAAVFAVGIMSHSQGDTTIDHSLKALMAFWAPFLINHLGGPDTITALALEDNELWLRHLLQLLSQLAATGYIFYKSPPSTELLAPTILTLLAGLIKYSERTRSMYLASAKEFRKSSVQERGPAGNYPRFMEEYTMRLEAGLPVDINHIEDDRDPVFVAFPEDDSYGMRSDLEMVEDAYMFVQMFKGLVVGIILGKNEWRESRDYFSQRNAEQAFRVVELELNFLYDFLHTKMVVIHGFAGYFFRLVSFMSVLVSFWIWYSMDKSPFRRHDLTITYSLLLGALTLDVIAFVMLIFSDLTIARVKFTQRMLAALVKKFLALSDRRWSAYTEKNKTALSKWVSGVFLSQSSVVARPTIPFTVLVSRIFNRRWSESIPQFNLIDYCVNVRDDTAEKVYEGLGLKDFLDGNKYVSTKWFSTSLRDSIFSQLRIKSDAVVDIKGAAEICNSRGEWVLQNILNIDIDPQFGLAEWITRVDYDESLILWHIATEVCYSHDLAHEQERYELREDEPCDSPESVHELESVYAAQRAADHREISKTISDYMLYLLIRQPKIITAVAGIGEFRFRDTCLEAKEFFKSRALNEDSKEERLRSALKLLLEVSTEIRPKEVMGDGSKGVLFEGCRLAKELNRLGEYKWTVIHKIWVEMLSYAAAHCSGNTHAAQLCKGGQLLTLVWLLMAHLGLGKQYLINEGNVIAQIVIDG